MKSEKDNVILFSPWLYTASLLRDEREEEKQKLQEEVMKSSSNSAKDIHS